MNIRDVNTHTPEGQLLIAALAILTTSPDLTINGDKIRGTSKTPDEMIGYV